MFSYCLSSLKWGGGDLESSLFRDRGLEAGDSCPSSSSSTRTLIFWTGVSQREKTASVKETTATSDSWCVILSGRTHPAWRLTKTSTRSLTGRKTVLYFQRLLNDCGSFPLQLAFKLKKEARLKIWLATIVGSQISPKPVWLLVVPEVQCNAELNWTTLTQSKIQKKTTKKKIIKKLYLVIVGYILSNLYNIKNPVK